jgi:hypothetical protein
VDEFAGTDRPRLTGREGIAQHPQCVDVLQAHGPRF